MRQRVFVLPQMTNHTGRWYGPDGHEISEAEALKFFSGEPAKTVAMTQWGGHRNPSGVLTVFAPWDLKAEPGTPYPPDRPPYIYGTAMFCVERRFMRRPREVSEFVHFSQTEIAARAAHDQAVEDVRRQRQALRRKPWRWIYWPKWLTALCFLLGALNILLWIIWGIRELAGAVI
jgi:hypothetical protein